jgi:pyruvate carboxylase
MRAASEMRIRTVAIYSQQDRQSLHRFKADESYLVGEGQKPLAAYLDGEDILRIARDRRASTPSTRVTASCPRTPISPRP